MELRKPQLSGTTSASGSNLQHEAAMRVEARYLADEKRRRRIRLMKNLKSLFFVAMLLLIIGGFYAWRKGILGAISPALGFKGQEEDLASGEAAVEEVPIVSAQKNKETVARIEQHIDAYNETKARFKNATMAYWKDAIPEDKPASKDGFLDYTALVPDASGGCVFLDVRLAGDNSMKIRKLMPTREPEEMPRAEFNKMIETTPFLVLREDRAYYCSARKPAPKTGHPIPAKGESFNPSRLEFGALYDQVSANKLALPTFKYDVFLNHPQFKHKLLVATVGFGEDVPRERFESTARTAVNHDEAVAAMLKFGKVDFSHAQKR